ncbi:MAG: hypothetical protein HKUEN07_07230 [Rhodocyclaceae bacterium]|nr:MAG: hypothetical protein HKUEN07_07230 [Rhodocyclaceae bacterium]
MRRAYLIFALSSVTACSPTSGRSHLQHLDEALSLTLAPVDLLSMFGARTVVLQMNTEMRDVTSEQVSSVAGSLEILDPEGLPIPHETGAVRLPSLPT